MAKHQGAELPDLIFADGIEPEVHFSGVDFGGISALLNKSSGSLSSYLREAIIRSVT